MPEQNDKHAEPTQLPLDLTTAEGDQQRSDQEEPDEGPVLEWTSHPVRRRPLVSVAVTLFVLVSGILMYWSTGSNIYTVLTLVVLFASLAKFYFPTTYLLNGKGIHIKTSTQKLFKPWSMYRSFYPDKKGILLSPFIRPSRLENFRGIYLMCADNLDEVRAFVRQHIAAPGKAKSASDSGEVP
jgi:hypothetical protein